MRPPAVAHVAFLFYILAAMWLQGCRWGNPAVDNPYPALRVDVVKNDAPNYSVLLRNNTQGRLQLVVRFTTAKNQSAEQMHEERLVLEPAGQASLLAPLDTRKVLVVTAFEIARR